MSILYVTAEFPFGVGESFLEDEVEQLSGRVALAILPVQRLGRRLRPTWESSTPVWVVSPVNGVGIWEFIKFYFRQPRRATRLIYELMGDRRHILKNLAVLPLAAAVSRKCRDHNIDHIHAHWLSTSGTVAWIAASISGLPFSITAHRWDIVDGNLASVKARRAAFVRFISEQGRQLFVESWGMSAGKLLVLPMGVNVNRSRPAGSSDKRLRVMCAANLIELKGHRHLLEAVRICRDLHDVEVSLDLAGDGPLRESLIRLTEDLGLAGQVKFCGQVSRSEIMHRYECGTYNCVSLPSLDLGQGQHEGVPVSLMEAMSFGLPVVATRTGAIDELVIDQVNGILVRAGDAGALALALQRLASHPEERERLGKEALATVREKFDSSATTTVLADMLQACSSDRR